MKLARYAAMAVAIIGLSLLGGCSTSGNIGFSLPSWLGGTTATGAGTVTTALDVAKKTDTTLHFVHASAARLATAAATAGLLKGGAASSTQHLIDESEGYLVQADHYIAAGDAANAQLQLGLAQSDIADVQAATPPVPVGH